MDVELKSISEANLALVLGMMDEFYRDQKIHFDADAATSALRQMLANPARGGAYLVLCDGGKELGRLTVEFAERVCRERRVKTLRLEVGHGNAAAQSLYQSMGFKRETRHLLTKLL